jgi:hypothetical protein
MVGKPSQPTDPYDDALLRRLPGRSRRVRVPLGHWRNSGRSIVLGLHRSSDDDADSSARRQFGGEPLRRCLLR